VEGCSLKPSHGFAGSSAIGRAVTDPICASSSGRGIRRDPSHCLWRHPPPAASQIPDSIVATVALLVGVYFVLLSAIIGCIIWISLKRLRARRATEEALEPQAAGSPSSGSSSVIKFSQAQILEGTKGYNPLFFVKKETSLPPTSSAGLAFPFCWRGASTSRRHPRRRSGEFGDVVSRLAQISSHPNW